MNKDFESEEDFTNQIKLTSMGWDASFQKYVDGAGIPARVVSVNKGQFNLNRGGEDWLATIAGKVRHKASSRGAAELYPVIGDWVLVQDTSITKVLPRRNTLSRGAAGGYGKKIGRASCRERVCLYV